MVYNSISSLYNLKLQANLIPQYTLYSGNINYGTYRASDNIANSYIVEMTRSAGASTPTTWNLNNITSSGSLFSGSGMFLPGNGWSSFVKRWVGNAPINIYDIFNFSITINGNGIPGQPSTIWTEFKFGILYGSTYALLYQETFPGGSLNFSKTYSFRLNGLFGD